MATKQRLLSLDIVRGITVAGMIMVNNSHGHAFEALRHAKWNGLSLSDFVFPFFLFIMGVSIFLSYSRRGFHLSWPNIGKILKRTLLLIIIGLAINWIDKILYTDFITSLEELRFWAVLQRIALCYFLVSIFALTVNHRYTLSTAIGLLIIYTVILLTGGGYINESAHNILYTIDERIFGYNHLYHYQAVDPEGLISTLSAVTNTLFGFYCAWLMGRCRSLEQKVIVFYTVGTLLTFTGFALHFGLPFNKRIWSPSFACITSGFCALLCGLMMQLIDVKRRRNALVSFFEVFGINALILYVSSELLAILLGYSGMTDIVFDVLQTRIPWFDGNLASLTYATLFMLINWIIGYPLWRHRIIIKL